MKNALTAGEGGEIVVIPLPISEEMLQNYADECDAQEWLEEQDFLFLAGYQARECQEALAGLAALAAALRSKAEEGGAR